MKINEEMAILLIKKPKRFSERENLSYKDDKVIVKVKALLMGVIKIHGVVEDS